MLGFLETSHGGSRARTGESAHSGLRSSPVVADVFLPVTVHGNHRWVALVVLLATAFVAIHHVAAWPEKLRYPGSQDMTEAVVLTESIKFQQPIPPYSAPSAETFVSANYGPLFYLLASVLVDSEIPPYAPLRLVSLVPLL